MIVLDLLVALLCAVALRSAWRELFVNVVGVHVARWPGPWSTPKVAALVILVAAATGLVAALLLAFALRDRGRIAARVVEIVALVAIAGAYVAWLADFFRNAGRFG